MLFARERVIPWKKSERQSANFTTAWAAAMPLTVALAQATTSTPIETRVMKAFGPLLSVIRATGYPLLMLYASAAALVIMTGNRERGIRMLRDAAIGYIALQFVPTIAQVLMEVSDAMKN